MKVPFDTTAFPLEVKENGHITQQRIGKFSISDAILEEAASNPAMARQLAKVMAQCIILRCEHVFASRTMEYVALSPAFDLNPVTCVPLLYKWEVAKNVRTVKGKEVAAYWVRARKARNEIDSITHLRFEA